MIDDMFEALRPKMVRYATLEEATKALEDAQRDKPHKGSYFLSHLVFHELGSNTSLANG